MDVRMGLARAHVYDRRGEECHQEVDRPGLTGFGQEFPLCPALRDAMRKIKRILWDFVPLNEFTFKVEGNDARCR